MCVVHRKLACSHFSSNMCVVHGQLACSHFHPNMYVVHGQVACSLPARPQEKSLETGRVEWGRALSQGGPRLVTARGSGARECLAVTEGPRGEAAGAGLGTTRRTHSLPRRRRSETPAEQRSVFRLKLRKLYPRSEHPQRESNAKAVTGRLSPQ